MQIGFLVRTPRGRCVTPLAYEHLGLPSPTRDEDQLRFEQLELGVFSDNARAIHLYESCGFHAWGTQPRAFKLKDGTYRDEIMMVRFFDESACEEEERT